VGPTSSSPAAVKTELEKLAYLRRLDAHTMDLSMLPAERRRFLAGLGRRLTPQALMRREPARRYPILLTLLSQSAVDVLDETLLLFDQAISGREAAAKQKVAEALAERAKGGENRQALLDEILTIVLDTAIGDEQIGGMLRTSIGMDRMRAAWAERRERLPRDHGQLSMLDASMSYLRQFANPGEVRLTDDGELIIPPLTAEDVPAEADALRAELAGMLPRVPIASVLVEVDARTGFTDHLVHAGGKVARPAELKRNLMYVIIAEAPTMGMSAMAESCGVP